MRAMVELSSAEKAVLSSLTGEEREAVIDQLIERARQDIERFLAQEQQALKAAERGYYTVRTVPPPIPRVAAGRR